jgi:predicted ATP-grasp superfamily ATP-dependent carboligase
MRVFVFEHMAGGGEGGDPPSAELVAQGTVMLQAVVADLVRAGCAVTTTRDGRVSLNVSEARVTTLDPGGAPAAQVDPHLRDCEAALIIAPETDGQLAQWTRHLERTGAHNLGSSAEAVALCGDKLALAAHLQANDIATPSVSGVPGEGPGPWAVKPRDGAGAEATYYVADRARARAWSACADTVCQPWVTGEPVSASVMVGDGSITPLRAGTQHIDVDCAENGAVRYTGGTLPLAPPRAERAMRLACDACRCVAGLHGFVGVDLVLGDSPAEDQVIEINPRLTMSYLGLTAMTEQGLGHAMLNRDRAPTWRDISVTFSAGGAITRNEMG